MQNYEAFIDHVQVKGRIMEMLLNDKKWKQVHEPTQLFRTQSIRAQTH